jgi:hypothetical protein
MTLSQTAHVHLNPTKHGLDFTVRPTDPYIHNSFDTKEMSFSAKIQGVQQQHVTSPKGQATTIRHTSALEWKHAPPPVTP